MEPVRTAHHLIMSGGRIHTEYRGFATNTNSVAKSRARTGGVDVGATAATSPTDTIGRTGGANGVADEGAGTHHSRYGLVCVFLCVYVCVWM